MTTGTRSRLVGVVMAAAITAGVVPAIAGATDYCVTPASSCPASSVTEPTFEAALAAAGTAPDADRVFLGADTYTAPVTNGFAYDHPSSPVEIIGQGIAQTVVTGQPGGLGRVLWLNGGTGTSVHDLTIRLPQNAAAALTGLITDNDAQRITIDEDPAQSNFRRGADLGNGATLKDSTVAIGTAQNTVAAALNDGGATVSNSVLSARTAISSSYGGIVERSHLTASQTGIDAIRNLTTINSSLIRLTGAGATGISVETQPGYQTTVHADGLTLVGPGLANTTGAYMSTAVFPDQSADVSLINSIVRGFSTALYVESTGAGHANLAAWYSDYDPTGNVTSGANAAITSSNVSSVGDAGFVDATGGDYHLRPSSPLIDSGDPTTLQGLDLEANPLVADGNGDGTERRDIGAFERQPTPPPAGLGADPTPLAGTDQQSTAPVADTQAPLITGFTATPAIFTTARAGTRIAARMPRATRLRYTLSEAAHVTVTIQRALPGRRQETKCVRPTASMHQAKQCTRYRTVVKLGRSAPQAANRLRFTGKIGGRPLPAGRYRAVITATDIAGNRATPRTARLRIAR